MEKYSRTAYASSVFFSGRGRRDGRGSHFYCRAYASSIFLSAVADPTARDVRFLQGLLSSVFLSAVAGGNVSESICLQSPRIFSIFGGRGRPDSPRNKIPAGPTYLEYFSRPWPGGVFLKQYDREAYKCRVFCRPRPAGGPVEQYSCTAYASSVFFSAVASGMAGGKFYCKICES